MRAMTQNMLGVKQAHEKYKFRKRNTQRDIGIQNRNIQVEQFQAIRLAFATGLLECPKVSSVGFPSVRTVTRICDAFRTSYLFTRYSPILIDK
jgi:hypothetical protein